MSDIMITVDSSQVIRARQELKQTADQALETLRASKKLTGEDRLAQHFATIDRQISKTNAAMSQANRRFAESQKGARSFELGIQQAGYQIGDFAVQVQSGTNPLVAFSQQFAQLAGFLGPWGAALGAVTAIIAGFGVYFMKASEGVDALSKSMEDLSKNTQQAKDELFALKLGYENAAQGAAIRQIIDLEVEAASLRQQAMQEEGLRAEYLANQALELEKQAAAARKALEENKNANKELDRGRASQESMTLSAQAALDKYSKMRTVAAGVANELSRAADESFRLAQQRIAASGLVYSGRGGDPRTSNQQGYGKFVYTGPALDTNNNIIPSKTDNGGGAGSARLDSLINQLQTERETLDEWYAQSQETLMSASESELQIIGGYNEAKLRLAKEYQDRLAKINEEGKDSQLQTVLSGSAEILGAMGAFSDKALRISKAFAAAEALVSTYKGAAKELEKGIIGFGTAAALIARGLAFVAAIKGVSSSGNTTSVSGGGSSTRGSATVAPTTAAAPNPQTVFIDSIDPKSLYSGQTLINLFDAFYDENNKRGAVFVVAR